MGAPMQRGAIAHTAEALTLPFGERVALETAPIVVVQDADLEHDPANHELLIGSILEDEIGWRGGVRRSCAA